jgi:hypothetical protein
MTERLVKAKASFFNCIDFFLKDEEDLIGNCEELMRLHVNSKKKMYLIYKTKFKI